jgi:pentatricopeptide repeat protein
LKDKLNSQSPNVANVTNLFHNLSYCKDVPDETWEEAVTSYVEYLSKFGAFSSETACLVLKGYGERKNFKKLLYYFDYFAEQGVEPNTMFKEVFYPFADHASVDEILKIWDAVSLLLESLF